MPIRLPTLILAAAATMPLAPAVGIDIADAGRQPDGLPAVAVSRERGPDGRISWQLSLGGNTIHRSDRPIADPRLVPVPASPTALLTWTEGAGKQAVAMAAAVRGGALAGRARLAPRIIQMRYAPFDPAQRIPAVPPLLQSAAASNLHLVQFIAPPLPEMRAAVEGAGGTLLKFLPDGAFAVRADDAARARIAALPIVRWVGPFHPAYKLDEQLIVRIGRGDPRRPVEPARYSVECFERGPEAQGRVAAAVAAVGGTIVNTVPEGFRVEAMLTPAQALAIARLDEVSFIDPWGPPDTDLNNARSPAGSDANFIESTLGFTGEGVRAEVMDFGFRKTHNAFQSPAPLIHGPERGENDNHGTSTYGIVFSTGYAQPNGRGFLPGRQQGIFASYLNLTENFGTITRYQHTAELTDPDGPYRAVFQSNSWGSQFSTQYTTISAELDDILFLYDIAVLHSMSNNGTQLARPQSWAKNVVTVGGLYHYNNADRADDAWAGGASIGPAADGRIKPDLVHFYDSVLCPTSTNDTAYTGSFGGTSAATPLTAGAFGLMFQMWHEGVFAGFGGGPSVFDDRPHMATAKALMINTAFRYDFAGQGHDLARTHQGWGMANLRRLYERRNAMFLVNQTDVIAPLQTISYTLRVQPGESELAITLAYADPKGAVNAAMARINDLSLRATSPGGTTYWGNHGLLDGNWSTPGGQSDTRDTVENIFIQNPAAGNWTIDILADEIVEDAHPQTQELDADFALIVTGASYADCYPDFDSDGDLTLFDFLAFVNAFNAAEPSADCDHNGVFDLFDFLCFVNAFNAGC